MLTDVTGMLKTSLGEGTYLALAFGDHVGPDEGAEEHAVRAQERPHEQLAMAQAGRRRLMLGGVRDCGLCQVSVSVPRTLEQPQRSQRARRNQIEISCLCVLRVLRGEFLFSSMVSRRVFGLVDRLE